MTNLDSILKSRDITLPTKIRLDKAMVFPVVMNGCESWTVKKVEHRRIDAFAQHSPHPTLWNSVASVSKTLVLLFEEELNTDN